MAKKPERNFTVQGSDLGFTGGLYTGKTPLAAAKKAGTKLFQAIDHGVKFHEDSKKFAKYKDHAEYAKYSQQKSVKFLLRETTQGSKKKSYFYEVTQNKFDEPKIVNRGGVQISVSRQIAVRACNESHEHMKK